MIRQLPSPRRSLTRITAPLRILVPAYNESTRIVPMLRDYCRRFENTAVIMVIANACTDDTVPVVRGLMDEFSNLELMEINARIGKGGAIRAGLKTGDEPYVGFADADGSTSGEEFERLFNECIQGDAAGVIGSRWLPGAVVQPRQPFMRRLASRAFNIFVRVLFGLPFTDTQCGAKIFRREAVRRVLPALEVADFSFDIDLLLNMHRNAFDVVEVPTVWSDSAVGTKVRLMRTSLTMLKAVLRLRLQESLLWRLPFADFLARSSIIPVKESTRVLVITDDKALDPWTAACVGKLSEYGCELVMSRDVSSRGHAGLLPWYAFRSKRDFDAIVEIASGRPSFIPAISAKQCFVIAPCASAAFSGQLYAYAYARAHRIRAGNGTTLVHSPQFGRQVLSDEQPETAALYIIEQIGAGTVYNAAFHRVADGWELRFNDLDSGTWTLQGLK